MTDLFLIAHKVRSEPAFDIAIILDQLDEDGDIIWIIPTSGHRAYPYWNAPLDGLGQYSDIGFYPDAIDPMPEGHRDHYHLEQTVAPNQPSLLSRLNLKPTPQPPIARRF